MTATGITGTENENKRLGCHFLYILKGITSGNNMLGIGRARNQIRVG
jgi:hypothetical protein